MLAWIIVFAPRFREDEMGSILSLSLSLSLSHPFCRIRRRGRQRASQGFTSRKREREITKDAFHRETESFSTETFGAMGKECSCWRAWWAPLQFNVVLLCTLCRLTLIEFRLPTCVTLNVIYQMTHTLSMVTVGQSPWDDIKIPELGLGHLISKF